MFMWLFWPRIVADAGDDVVGCLRLWESTLVGSTATYLRIWNLLGPASVVPFEVCIRILVRISQKGTTLKGPGNHLKAYLELLFCFKKTAIHEPLEVTGCDSCNER